MLLYGGDVVVFVFYLSCMELRLVRLSCICVGLNSKVMNKWWLLCIVYLSVFALPFHCVFIFVITL